ncbi:MAG TPA: BamA/TamA family outer membrane protein [Gemmatimonadaceae bacterium]|nr:BamA/TamA family outer membrane protein [Gemmatimonadaceae bacterium]
MRTLAIACCLAIVARGALAQQPADTTQRVDSLSYDDAAEVAFLYDQPAAMRSSEPLVIPVGQVVDGDVAVLEAPLTVAGHVTGRVVVINGDVTIRPGGRIDGELLVTGGRVLGADSATVGGRVRVWKPSLLYHLENDRVVAEQDESKSMANWFRRWSRRHQRSQSRLILKGGTYNRVEGLPVLGGAGLRRNFSTGRSRVEALGIWRSADGFEWKGENLGYTVSGEVQFGFGRAIALGAEAFDVVQPVESWQLRDSEIGLASFFLHRDYRDYYNRHGARGYVSLRDGTTMSLTLSYARERWQARAARDPFTLFRNSAPWRPNPLLDEGRFNLLGVDLTLDTRNDPNNPWTGWLIAAQLEHGWSPEVIEGPTGPLARPAASGPVRVHYTRGFLDARRYNRVSPTGQLNFRLVLGGWLGGDPLPLERRFALGGAGTLPGYDFRQFTGGEDVLTCGGGVVIDGIPGQCDRMALLQAEYRGDIRVRLLERRGDFSFHHPLQWVVFTDAGRGWIAHGGPAGESLGDTAFPSLDTFKSDIGLGLDADVLGLFLAKSLTDGGNPVNFFIRLRHRF